MTEVTSSDLHAAEEQLANAKAKLAEVIAARDRAKSALEQIEQKRRGFARDFLLGLVRDPKATRAAANERNDAQNGLEDMELLVDEAQSAVQRAQGLIISRRFESHWGDVLELGARHADILEKVITARDTMFAAMTEYAVIGREIGVAATRAKLLFPSGIKIMGVNPSHVQQYVGADVQNLANVMADTMPNDIFRAMPENRGFGRGYPDALDQERSFWESQKLDEPNAGQKREAAA